MKNIFIKGTNKSPFVNLNADKGIIEGLPINPTTKILNLKFYFFPFLNKGSENMPYRGSVVSSGKK